MELEEVVTGEFVSFDEHGSGRSNGNVPADIADMLAHFCRRQYGIGRLFPEGDFDAVKGHVRVGMRGKKVTTLIDRPAHKYALFKVDHCAHSACVKVVDSAFAATESHTSKDDVSVAVGIL